MHVDFYWSVLIYISHILWLWDINLRHIFYIIFSKLRIWRWHFQSIIIKLAYCEQKALVCLFSSTNNMLTIALLFHTMSTHKHASTISICCVSNPQATMVKERLWWAIVGKYAMILWSSSQFLGQHIPVSLFRIMLADWWLTDYVISRIWVWKVF